MSILSLDLSLGKIVLPPGVHLLNERWNLANSEDLEISGHGSRTVLKMADGVNASGVIRGGAVKNLYLHDFIIDGNRGFNSDGIGVQFLDQNAVDVRIERVTVLNCYDQGFGISGSEFKLRDVVAKQNRKSGLAFNGPASDCEVVGAHIFENGLDGQLGDGISNQGKRNRFARNRIWENSDTGLNLAGEGHQAFANYIWLNGNSGINSGGGDDLIIQANHAWANGRKTSDPRSNAGIRIRDHTGGSLTTIGAILALNRCHEDLAKYPLPSGANGQKYGLEIIAPSGGGDPDYIIASLNDFRNNLTENLRVVDLGPNSIIKDNFK